MKSRNLCEKPNNFVQYDCHTVISDLGLGHWNDCSFLGKECISSNGDVSIRKLQGLGTVSALIFVKICTGGGENCGP